MPKFDVLEEKKRALERDIVALDEEIDHKVRQIAGTVSIVHYGRALRF